MDANWAQPMIEAQRFMAIANACAGQERLLDAIAALEGVEHQIRLAKQAMDQAREGK